MADYLNKLRDIEDKELMLEVGKFLGSYKERLNEGLDDIIDEKDEYVESRLGEEAEKTERRINNYSEMVEDSGLSDEWKRSEEKVLKELVGDGSSDDQFDAEELVDSNTVDELKGKLGNLSKDQLEELKDKESRSTALDAIERELDSR